MAESNVIGAIAVKLSVSNAQFIKGMDQAQRSLASFTVKAQAMSSALTSFGTQWSLMISTPIIAASYKSVQAMMEQEGATSRLGAALAKQGKDVAKVLPGLEKFAALVQDTTVYGDEMVESVMSQGIALGIDGDQIQNVTQAAIGLAEKTGRSLPTAMMLLARANKGHTEMFSRMGLTVDKTKSKQQQYQDILQQGASYYDMAVTKGNTLQGQFAKMKNQMGEVAEAFGQFLITGLHLPEVLRVMTDGFRRLAKWIAGLSPWVKDALLKFILFAVAIGPVALAIAKIIRIVMGAIKAFQLMGGIVGLLSNPVTAVVIAVVALGIALISIFGKGNTFKEKVDNLGLSFEKIATEWIPAFIEAIQEAWIKFKYAFLYMVEIVKWWADVTFTFWGYLWDNFKIGLSWLQDNWKGMLSNLWEMFKAFISNLWEDVMNVVGIFGALWEAIKNPSGDAFKAVVDQAAKAGKGIVENFTDPLSLLEGANLKEILGPDFLDPKVIADMFMSLPDRLATLVEKRNEELGKLHKKGTEIAAPTPPGKKPPPGPKPPPPPIEAQPRFAAAIMRGSAEAYAAELGVKSTSQKIEKNTAVSAEEAKKNNDLLAKMLAELTGGGATEDIEADYESLEEAGAY